MITIGGCGPSVWCVLGTFGRLVLEVSESLIIVAGHGYVEGARFVVAIERKWLPDPSMVMVYRDSKAVERARGRCTGLSSQQLKRMGQV
jgi:hypothetical protein